MTTLKQLIDQHCPGGVDYVRLGDVVTIKNGSDWKTQEPGSVAVYGSGGKMGAKVRIPASTEPSVLLPRKGSLEVQFVDTPFWNIDTAFRTETDPTRLCMKYFYYSMKGFNLSEISTSATRPSLTQTALKELSFPLPPREVQDKIVEYLDTFAEMCENLDTDIAQRERQFAAYREKLLSVEYLTTRHGPKGVDYVQLGDTSLSNIGGGTPRRDNPDFWGGDIPWASVGDLTAAGRTLTACRQQITEAGLQGSSSKMVDTGTLLIATRMSPGLAKLTEIPVAINQDIRALTFKDFINPKFVSYVLQETRFETNGTIVKSITSKQINEVTIPFPPHEVQDEIVAKLDAMQELIDNLRLERQQRQQQFDHYRERLLSFPKKNTAEV
ncbi:restriction endonuclease subunit S [Corynebacterium sp.]|uniref:restriction endonuclease subunit S n=1 Tax=Corynebacterium sp. TaxID=1720 RepID=UPI00258EF7AA|nr:restriction endonuclease subunit S [Corynebacterium sp.]